MKDNLSRASAYSLSIYNFLPLEKNKYYKKIEHELRSIFLTDKIDSATKEKILKIYYAQFDERQDIKEMYLKIHTNLKNNNLEATIEESEFL